MNRILKTIALIILFSAIAILGYYLVRFRMFVPLFFYACAIVTVILTVTVPKVEENDDGTITYVKNGEDKVFYKPTNSNKN